MGINPYHRTTTTRKRAHTALQRCSILSILLIVVCSY
ncbi:hypothetical protein [Vibrio phage 33Fb.4]|nr:hypothetical protein [Vibrio phage 31Fb.4]WAG58454.1 hypothetical protein [Vibrio phage 33Fb.4]